MIDGIRAGGKGISSPKFIQVGQSLADISFYKFGMLDVDVIETLIFTEKTYGSKNNATCENTVARTYESWTNPVMGSCVIIM